MKRIIPLILFLVLTAESNAQNENVFISGEFLQTKMPSVNLLYYDIVKEGFGYVAKTKVSDRGKFEMRFQLTEPVYCKFYEDFFYVSPGDTIHLSVTDDSLASKRYRLTITGNNTAHYEFSNFLKLNSIINMDRELKRYSGNWTEFQKTCKKNYQNEVALLNEYSLKHKVSEQFRSFFKDEFYSEYLMNLLLPFTANRSESYSTAESYLKSIGADTLFNSAGLFRHQPYRQFCQDFLKHIIKTKTKSIDRHNENLLLYTFVNENYNGRIREYFLTFLFNKLIKLKTDESDKIVEKIFAGSNQFSDQELKNHILKKYVLNANINQHLPDSILNIELSDSKGKKTELGKVINSLRGKYILIDNWASWCGPCLQEIYKSKEIVKTGVLNKDSIEILYLSQDESRLKWKRAVSKNKNLMRNSYLFVGFPNAFSLYFNISSIPRYILLNKEGKLISLDAPRVSEYPDLLKLIK
jgi:thiol-disulfide isomerase/thioredoxin